MKIPISTWRLRDHITVRVKCTGYRFGSEDAFCRRYESSSGVEFTSYSECSGKDISWCRSNFDFNYSTTVHGK